MCHYLQVTGWSCTCALRPSHNIPRRFLQRCERYGSTEQDKCQAPTTNRSQEVRIAFLCPECCDYVIQNRYRPLYGITSSTVTAVMADIDRADTEDREFLRGGDLAVRNQLECTNFNLAGHVIRAARKLLDARDFAIRGILGDKLYEQRWGKCAQNGQRYPFVPYATEPCEEMWTEGEERERALPTYENHRIVPPAPRRLEGFEWQNPPPEYTDLFPETSLEPFKPLDVPANVAALEENYDSDVSDEGERQTKVEALFRLRRRLRSELKELSKTVLKPRTNTSISSESLLSDHLDHLRLRRNQVGEQISVLTQLVKEERTLINATRYARRGQNQNNYRTGAQYTRGLRIAELRLNRLAGRIYRNRSNHSLSQLLIPRNATDPSRVTTVALMPPEHASMFEPRVIGFPAHHAKGQLQKYKAILDYDDFELSDREREEEFNDDAFEIFNQQDDVAPWDANRSNLMSDISKAFEPVANLWRVPAQEDEGAPCIRLLRPTRGMPTFHVICATSTADLFGWPSHLSYTINMSTEEQRNLNSRREAFVGLRSILEVYFEATRAHLRSAAEFPPVTIEPVIGVSGDDADRARYEVFVNSERSPPITEDDLRYFGLWHDGDVPNEGSEMDFWSDTPLLSIYPPPQAYSLRQAYELQNTLPEESLIRVRGFMPPHYMIRTDDGTVHHGTEAAMREAGWWPADSSSVHVAGPGGQVLPRRPEEPFQILHSPVAPARSVFQREGEFTGLFGGLRTLPELPVPEAPVLFVPQAPVLFPEVLRSLDDARQLLQRTPGESSDESSDGGVTVGSMPSLGFEDDMTVGEEGDEGIGDHPFEM